MDLKAAFLICPIGEEGSPEREWSNDIYMELVIPVCKEFGIRVERANDDDRPGEIPARIMEHLDRDGLVIADLTFRNPNVFYELCFRHQSGRPYIHMAAKGTPISFDVNQHNTIFIDRMSLQGGRLAREDLARHIRAVKDGQATFDNPVLRHRQKVAAVAAGNTQQIELVDLREELGVLRQEVNTLHRRNRVLEKVAGLDDPLMVVATVPAADPHSLAKPHSPPVSKNRANRLNEILWNRAAATPLRIEGSSEIADEEDSPLK